MAFQTNVKVDAVNLITIIKIAYYSNSDGLRINTREIKSVFCLR